MNSVEAKRLLESVHDNHSALAACSRHSFVSADERPIFKKYRCERCGGTVDAHAKLWYETGLAHSRTLVESPPC